jgi:hypothetical protein
MSNEFDYDFNDDVSLDTDEKNVGGGNQDWFKMSAKKQIVRAAFVYFHTVDANAVNAATKVAKRANKTLSREEVVEIAKKALTERAAKLQKEFDKLSATDKLELSTAHFKAMKAHYKDGLGFALSRLGKDGPESDAVWKRLPEAKPYFTTVLLIYPTDSEGALNKEEFASQVKGGKLNVKPWRFGNRTYENVWKLNDTLRENGLSLASQDVKLECKDPKYQNIEASAAGPAVWQKNPTIAAAVLASAVNFYDKLMPFREMTTDQLREKLGLTSSATDDVSVSSDNFQEMLDNV